MPLYMPTQHFAYVWRNTTAASTTPGSNIADPSTAHSLSGYTQIVSSLEFDTDLLCFHVYGYGASTADRSALVDIATGAAASEVVLIDGLIGGHTSGTAHTGITYVFPLRIPAGTRIAWRMQGAATSGTIRLIMEAFGGTTVPMWVGQTVESLGVDRLTSNGTTFTIGNSGAEGSWTNIGSPITRAAKAVVLGIGGPTADTSMNNAGYVIDVGYSSNTIHGGENISLNTTTGEIVAGPLAHRSLIYADIPDGTQMQVRGSCSGTAEALRACLYVVS